jgi:aminoglycoside phosphotransferase (APT) family kinase protein
MSTPPPLSEAELREIEALRELVPALRGREVAVRKLAGGLTNRNYRLDAGGESYVLRIAGAGTGLLGIDRGREVACARAAAAAGVGPEVVAYLPERSALLTRFAPGRGLKVEDLSRPDVLGRVVAALRRCHDHPVPPDLGAFSPFTTIRAYDALAREKGVPVPAETAAALDRLSRIEVELRTDEPPCLYHNDLLAGNFLDDGEAARIIDWEYGGLGDRFFDLGNFAVNQQLGEEGERRLLDLYFGRAQPEDLRRLRLMRGVSDLREATWGFVQAALSRLHGPEYYLDYGRRHLERFVRAGPAS